MASRSPEDFDLAVVHVAVRERALARVGTSLHTKYSLDRLIGIGGAAAVYAGRREDGLPVALKVLHPELAALPDARRRFLRESYIANRIQHPGVVRVLDDDETPDGIAYVAMDLLVGRTLEAAWRDAARRSFEPARVVDIATALLDVLHAAHEASVVHRDLKPDNVFMARSPSGAESLKVLDFGLARLLDHPQSTPIGDALGTAEFVAPEQARGLLTIVDARSDLYSVGAIMYSLLTGKYVHHSHNPLERLVLAATKPARSIRAVMPEIDEELAHVIDVALSFRQRDRWPSARAMAIALGDASR